MIHTVRPGEKTSTIAARYGVTVDELLTANAHRPTVRLAGGERVFAALGEGEELVVPKGNHGCPAHYHNEGTLYRDCQPDDGSTYDEQYPRDAGCPPGYFVEELPPYWNYPPCVPRLLPSSAPCPASSGVTHKDRNGVCVPGEGPDQAPGPGGAPPPSPAPPTTPTTHTPTAEGAEPQPERPTPHPWLALAIGVAGVAAAAGAIWWGARQMKAPAPRAANPVPLPTDRDVLLNDITMWEDDWRHGAYPGGMFRWLDTIADDAGVLPSFQELRDADEVSKPDLIEYVSRTVFREMREQVRNASKGQIADYINERDAVITAAAE